MHQCYCYGTVINKKVHFYDGECMLSKHVYTHFPCHFSISLHFLVILHLPVIVNMTRCSMSMLQTIYVDVSAMSHQQRISYVACYVTYHLWNHVNETKY